MIEFLLGVHGVADQMAVIAGCWYNRIIPSLCAHQTPNKVIGYNRKYYEYVCLYYFYCGDNIWMEQMSSSSKDIMILLVYRLRGKNYCTALHTMLFSNSLMVAKGCTPEFLE